jgi:hypothetical protein
MNENENNTAEKLRAALVLFIAEFGETLDRHHPSFSLYSLFLSNEVFMGKTHNKT